MFYEQLPGMVEEREEPTEDCYVEIDEDTKYK